MNSKQFKIHLKEELLGFGCTIKHWKNCSSREVKFRNYNFKLNICGTEFAECRFDGNSAEDKNLIYKNIDKFRKTKRFYIIKYSDLKEILLGKVVYE